ncbi:MAG: NAD(+)/NADH kinase [Deltaproteobacteria bacterium]|nr:MAG: NAD(+)/NADH kinase [Deltaproteobacteria bacterium]
MQMDKVCVIFYEGEGDQVEDCLSIVIKVLNDAKVIYSIVSRDKVVSTARLAQYDIIITVGGDGTLLGVCHYVSGQIVIGVNSNLEKSVGGLCVANKLNFKEIFNDIIGLKLYPLELVRIKVSSDTLLVGHSACNDIMLVKKNKMGLLTLEVNFGCLKEQFKCTSLIISTPCGSTGIIRDFGGEKIGIKCSYLQWLATGLWNMNRGEYLLASGILKAAEKIYILSPDHDIAVFIDGNYCSFSLAKGMQLSVELSLEKIKLVSSFDMEKRRHMIDLLCRKRDLNPQGKSGRF